MLRSSQITKWTDVSPKLPKKSSRRGGNVLLSITNAAQTTSLFCVDYSHLHGEVMWFLLWIKPTPSCLHPGCAPFIVLALGIISVSYACFGEWHASVLFSSFQVSFSGYLRIWEGEAKLTPRFDSCGVAEHQEPCRNELLLALAAPVFLRVSGKVFPFSSPQPLQSRRQGDFWG